MTTAPIHFRGERLMLDPTGALLWPAAGIMVVSDLHLEKGSSFARKGMLLPPWDTRATLDRLAALLRRYNPAIVVTLGDTFHDDAAAERLAAADRARLAAMARSHRFVWVLGNHDPTPPADLAGDFVTEFTTHPLTFRHQASLAAAGEIVGHHHPKAAIPARGALISRPCFVTDARRIIMPAFGTYTGGLDVSDPAITALFPRGCRVFLLGRDRLFSFALGPGRRG